MIYGVRVEEHKLLKSYLADRTQVVYWKDSMSAKKSVSCGVRQESIVGPILFITNTNNIPEYLLHVTVWLCANDIYFIITSNSAEPTYFIRKKCMLLYV